RRPDLPMPPHRATLISRIHRALSYENVRDVFPGLSSWLIEVRAAHSLDVGDAPPLALAPAFQP
ncbi:MAG: hypothetical protein OEO77_10595, partial [Acidimicrobiia bacterium]|nr:hypothetical protein [Acidimicrobiia bacterium]